MDQFTKQLLDEVGDLEPHVGLPQGFCLGLLKDDDWSFVIKIHALIETSLTRLLCAIVEPEPLKELIVTLDVSGGRFSKVTLLKHLNAIQGHEVKAIREISKIRNRFVHNIKYVGFDLTRYIADLPLPERDEFARNTLAFAFDEDPPKAERDKAISEPKTHLWRCGLFLTALSKMRTDNRRLEAQFETQESEHSIIEKENLLREKLLLERELAALRHFVETITKPSAPS